MMKLRFRMVAAALGALGALLGSAWGSLASPTTTGHLYVSPQGSDQASCTSAAPCRTIQHAVDVGRAGDEIDVASGMYSGQVTITKRLILKGSHGPVIDATGHGRGILIKGSKAAGSQVEGFVVKGATYEAILALQTSHILIAHNVARHNDQGFFHHHYTGECTYNGQPPSIHKHPARAKARGGAADLRAGGCGESIHLASTSYSRVIDNYSTQNTGGIYLTDESAPAAHNLVAHNRVIGNLYDCGITLASHSTRTVTAKGRVLRHAGGVYDNTIIDNVANDNGTKKPGTGILVAAAFGGGAAYDNRIIGNTVSGNGLPGIALHSHDVRQDLNGNVIRNNVVGHNAIGGANGKPGDGDAGVTHTVGILVWSWSTPLKGTVVLGNHISHDYFGVWTEHVPTMKRSANSYRHVRVPLKQRRP